ncbi:hypothetical protein [Agromyces sp. ZXT2-6]|uniref:hypothetical protein n=1 Tax=Agromyces sp. ZXT2-6 TaxID=3461153 RepID=UPI004054D739
MHAASGGGFFDVDPPEPPPEPEVPPVPPWIQPPRDEVPGRVLLDEVLFRSDRVVLLLRELRRFSTGVEIRLGWIARSAGMPHREWDQLMQEVMGWHGYQDGDRALRAGLVLPDGRPLRPLHLTRAWDAGEATEPPTLVVNQGGSGGGPDHYDGRHSAWLWWPELPDGDLELVYECRGFGIPQGTRRIPASVLAAAPAPRPLWD